jgi:hypothetical protein
MINGVLIHFNAKPGICQWLYNAILLTSQCINAALAVFRARIMLCPYENLRAILPLSCDEGLRDD